MYQMLLLKHIRVQAYGVITVVKSDLCLHIQTKGCTMASFSVLCLTQMARLHPVLIDV